MSASLVAVTWRSRYTAHLNSTSVSPGYVCHFVRTLEAWGHLVVSVGGSAVPIDPHVLHQAGQEIGVLTPAEVIAEELGVP